jgi:hypothetical protein
VAFYEVMWKGYKETTNKARDELLKDVPKMINQFEKKNKTFFYKNENNRTGEINSHQGLSWIHFFKTLSQKLSKSLIKGVIKNVCANSTKKTQIYIYLYLILHFSCH